MNKYTENEEANQVEFKSDSDRALDITTRICKSIIEAKGEKFLLDNKCIYEMMSTVFSQIISVIKISSGTKKPAISVEDSVHADYIICLEDGAKVKMLKKYIKKRYNMSPVQYISKWNLRTDYPMVAPAYSDQRRQLAVQAKLGHMRGSGASKKKVAAR